MGIFRPPYCRCFKTAAAAIVVLAAVSSQKSLAQQPNPKAVQEELEAARQKIIAEEKAAEALRAEQEAIEHELNKTRQKAVSHTEKALALEEELLALEAEQIRLNKEMRVIRTRLEKDTEDLQQVLRALQRHAKAPSEVLLLLHNDPAAAGRAGQLLTGLYKRHNAQLADLRRNLQERDLLQKQAAQNAIQVKNRQAALEREQQSIAKLQQQKQKKLKETAEAIEERQQKTKQLASKATTIEALLKEIDQQLQALPKPGGFTLRKLYGPQKIAKEKPPKKVAKPSRKPKKQPKKSVAVNYTGNKLLLPVAGRLKSKFGTTIQGVRQTGMRYSTRQNATVRAPAKGKVVYAGDFRGYGKMVIIDHTHLGLHSVLGNIGRIDISSGQWLDSGEPLGKSGNEFYLEVRRRGTAVNPVGYLKK